LKSFITSYLVDVVDDDFANTGLTDSQIDEATEFIWEHYDCSHFYEQVDRLLELFLTKK
jgi:hypothetical protein